MGQNRAGTLSSTEFNYTNQRKDAGTGLLFYNARYYDPALGRFLSADSIVPGSADGSGGAAASLGYDDTQSLRPLTVDFHEKNFLTAVNEEHDFTLKQGFWFQLSDTIKQDAATKEQWGPKNAQALNRYAYVLNNPLRYTDPNGHKKIDRNTDLIELLRALDDAIDEVANTRNWELFTMAAGVVVTGGFLGYIIAMGSIAHGVATSRGMATIRVFKGHIT